MGMVMSFMGTGMPSTQMFNLLMGTLYHQFTEKEICTFEDFHQAFLDIFNTVNSALPGRHYDTPSRKQVEEYYYDTWLRSNWLDRKKLFVEFMKTTMNLSRLDHATMMTGIVTPPAAMAAKKAGENVPQVGIIKAIPDVIFVPSVTLIALITAKLSRKIIQRKKSSHPEPSRPPSPQKTWPTPSIPAKVATREPLPPWYSSNDTRREPPRPAPQIQSSHQTRATRPRPVSPPPSPLAAPSSQKQPSVPTKGQSWTWYSPTPQPGFPRTRQREPR